MPKAARALSALSDHPRAGLRALRERAPKAKKGKREGQDWVRIAKRKEAEEARREANENRRQAAENRKQELHQWAVLLAQAKVDHQQMLTSDVRFNQTLAQLKEEDRKSIQTAA